MIEHGDERVVELNGQFGLLRYQARCQAEHLQVGAAASCRRPETLQETGELLIVTVFAHCAGQFEQKRHTLKVVRLDIFDRVSNCLCPGPISRLDNQCAKSAEVAIAPAWIAMSLHRLLQE